MDDGVLDLFGNPVDLTKRGRGRPPFEKTAEKVMRVRYLLAFGWTDDQIANALDCSVKTLQRYFSLELKVRAMARDKLKAWKVERLLDQVAAGNVSAIKLLDKKIEAIEREEAVKRFGEQKSDEKKDPPKTGKKEGRIREAGEVAAGGGLWGGDLDPRTVN